MAIQVPQGILAPMDLRESRDPQAFRAPMDMRVRQDPQESRDPWVPQELELQEMQGLKA